ncbi:7191_t:CDS:2 [Cetraspora pellucida]|uniref:7191_t:CDS:1 n=1 Tax=Cetraspora pellucida TaxID=1433469 RepID=A0A9N9CLE2_9GLOM|nr:7191_t:CDS:2 [Cetraspora pellucida]
MKFDLILNKNITPSVNTSIEFFLNNKKDKFNYIDILACKEPKSSIEKVITNSSKKQKLERYVTNKNDEKAQYGECQIIKDDNT